MALRLDFLKLLLARYTGAARTQRKPDVFDALASFPGREALPWSLGSVLGAAVARFLPCRVVGVLGAALPLTSPTNLVRQMEVSPDGTLLYLLQYQPELEGANVFLYARATGARLAQTCMSDLTSFTVASDGAVFVASSRPYCVHVLTHELVLCLTLASLDRWPTSLATSLDCVFVLMDETMKLTVLDRASGAERDVYPRPFIDNNFWPESLCVADDALVVSGCFTRYVQHGGWCSDFTERIDGVVVFTLDIAPLHVLRVLYGRHPAKSLTYHAATNEVLLIYHPDTFCVVSLRDGSSRQLAVAASHVAASSRGVLVMDTPMRGIRELQ